MPVDSPKERRVREERPRVGPAVWLIVLLAIGIGLLYRGANRAWFVGILGASCPPTWNYSLAWALLGAGYGAFAVFVWTRLGRRPTRAKVVLALIVVLVPMLAGSQVAARYAEGSLVLVVTAIRWEPGAREFVVDVMAPPHVVSACERGYLTRTIHEIRGPSRSRG